MRTCCVGSCLPRAPSAPPESARTQDVLPRHVARMVGFLRKAEHALTEDVAPDRRGAALDRVRLRTQEAAGDGARPVRSATDEAERLLAGEALAFPRDPVGSLEVDGQPLQPLVELGALQLGDRALGPGFRAAATTVGGALVV